ncbi:MAG: hypothetical protein IJT89_07500 [Bacteroidaceae bacterium]|nr:hypothetical protein [Bacteroidaceae bacterium]
MNNNNKNNEYGVVPCKELEEVSFLRLVNQYSYSDIYRAYLDCRRRKRSTLIATAYETRHEFRLMDLLEQINSGRYEIGSTRAFVVTWPKAREVWAARFADRIVHHLICNDIASFFNDRLIEDTFACIKGRGTLAASNRVSHFARSITQNWNKKAWVLQIDIANYFVSISRAIMWELLKKHIGTDSLTAKLTKMIVFNDPTKNVIIKPNTDFSIVPRHKSLWHCKKGYGLPIGNLTSQVFANVYLDGLDKYVKHTLKCKYYARYVDDAILMSKDREQLYDWRDKIDAWLKANRELHLHPNKVRIAPVADGIDFVGKVIRPFSMTPRAMTIGSARAVAIQLQKNPLDKGLLHSINSYLGLSRHCDSYRFRKLICEMVCLPFVIGCDQEYTKVFHLI